MNGVSTPSSSRRCANRRSRLNGWVEAGGDHPLVLRAGERSSASRSLQVAWPLRARRRVDSRSQRKMEMRESYAALELCAVSAQSIRSDESRRRRWPALFRPGSRPKTPASATPDRAGSRGCNRKGRPLLRASSGSDRRSTWAHRKTESGKSSFSPHGPELARSHDSMRRTLVRLRALRRRLAGALLRAAAARLADAIRFHHVRDLCRDDLLPGR